VLGVSTQHGRAKTAASSRFLTPFQGADLPGRRPPTGPDGIGTIVQRSRALLDLKLGTGLSIAIASQARPKVPPAGKPEPELRHRAVDQ